MQWHDAYPQATQPAWDEIRSFIAGGLWDDLTQYLETSYNVKPLLSYSNCSAQPGWNVKYKKGGEHPYGSSPP